MILIIGFKIQSDFTPISLNLIEIFRDYIIRLLVKYNRVFITPLKALIFPLSDLDKAMELIWLNIEFSMYTEILSYT